MSTMSIVNRVLSISLNNAMPILKTALQPSMRNMSKMPGSYSYGRKHANTVMIHFDVK